VWPAYIRQVVPILNSDNATAIGGLGSLRLQALFFCTSPPSPMPRPLTDQITMLACPPLPILPYCSAVAYSSSPHIALLSNLSTMASFLPAHSSNPSRFRRNINDHVQKILTMRSDGPSYHLMRIQVNFALRLGSAQSLLGSECSCAPLLGRVVGWEQKERGSRSVSVSQQNLQYKYSWPSKVSSGTHPLI